MSRIKLFNFKGAKYPIPIDRLETGSFFDILLQDCKDNETVDFGEQEMFKDVSYNIIQTILPMDTNYNHFKNFRDVLKYITLVSQVGTNELHMSNVVTDYITNFMKADEIEYFIPQLLDLIDRLHINNQSIINLNESIQKRFIVDCSNSNYNIINNQVKILSSMNWFKLISEDNKIRSKIQSLLLIPFQNILLDTTKNDDYELRNVDIPDCMLCNFWMNIDPETPTWDDNNQCQILKKNKLLQSFNYCSYSNNDVVETLEQFKENFTQFTFGLFEYDPLKEYMRQHKIIVAGGMIGECIRKERINITSDVDIFVLDTSIFYDVITYFQTYATNNSKRAYLIENQPGVIDIVIDDIPVIYSVIVSFENTVTNLLVNFDFTHCMVAFDGIDVLTLNDARYSWKTQKSRCHYIKSLYMSMHSDSISKDLHKMTARRLVMKCCGRGFDAMIVYGNEIDEYIYEYATQISQSIDCKNQQMMSDMIPRPIFLPTSIWNSKQNEKQLKFTRQYNLQITQSLDNIKQSEHMKKCLHNALLFKETLKTLKQFTEQQIEKITFETETYNNDNNNNNNNNNNNINPYKRQKLNNGIDHEHDHEIEPLDSKK
jgi:hypothetical protein